MDLRRPDWLHKLTVNPITRGAGFRACRAGNRLGLSADPAVHATVPEQKRPNSLRRIRICLLTVILGLVLSGVTAFPLQSELRWLVTLFRRFHPIAPGLLFWLEKVHSALADTNRDFPFLAYGTDWLAFAHLILGVLFLGPLVDPVRNKWVIAFGLIACAGVIPLALIAGSMRGIPLFWRLIDCSFGVFGAVPLAVAWRDVTQLERTSCV